MGTYRDAIASIKATPNRFRLLVCNFQRAGSGNIIKTKSEAMFKTAPAAKATPAFKQVKSLMDGSHKDATGRHWKAMMKMYVPSMANVNTIMTLIALLSHWAPCPVSKTLW